MNPKTAVEQLIARKWGTEEIAKRVGIHRSHVYRILNGHSPNYRTVVALDEFVKSKDKPPKVAK